MPKHDLDCLYLVVMKMSCHVELPFYVSVKKKQCHTRIKIE